MADESSNTDPRKGRPSMKLAQESNRLQKKIVEGNEDNQSALSQQVALMSSFTETIANYIPKLGFIDAHTAALKLKQDQAFKVLEKIEGHLAKNTEQTQELVDETPADEESDADQVQPDSEDVGAGQDGTPAQQEAAEDGRSDGDPLEKIAEDVAAIRQIMSEGGDDARGGLPDGDEPPVTETSAKAGKTPKAGKGILASLGPIGRVLSKIGKLFTVFNLIIMGLIASLLTANSELFTKIKELFGTIMQVFMKIVGIVVEKILPAVTQIFTIIIDLINQLLPPLMEVFTAVVDIVMSIVEALIPVVITIVDVVMGIVDIMLPIIMSIVDAIMPIIEMMLDVLVPIIEVVLGVMMFIFDTILAPIFSAIAPVVEFVGDLFRGLFNGIITMINGVIEGIAMIVGIFSDSKAEEMRAMKMDKIEKDESKDEAKNIDFSQDDATVDAQIQAKLDSGEINQKTADKLKKDKEKFAKAQEKDRKEFIEKIDVKQVEVPQGEDGDKLKLISMDLSEPTDGALGQMLFDPDSLDENGNYQFYTEDGQPMSISGIARPAVMMAAHAAVEDLQKVDAEADGGGMFDMAAILGMTPNETQGQDLGNESLDMAEAQQDANSQGGGSTTNSATTISSTVGGSNSKTVILNDAASGSPQDGRGYYATPN